MNVPDIATVWATYKVQILVGLAVVVVAFLLLRVVGRIFRFGAMLALGAGLGVGAAYGMTRFGVPAQFAYWGAVVITLVVLLLGTRRAREG
jgi:hypothetical protein